MALLQRFVYRAYALPDCADAAAAHLQAQTERLAAAVREGRQLTISLFRWRHHFFVYYEFVYYEAIAAPLPLAELLGDGAGLLAAWPGDAEPRYFVPMMDIFHCGEPESVDQWRRQQPVEQIWGRLARLRPQMVSSYIFYHYQLQEEKPGSFDKYCLISLHENLIFFYQEQPAVVESPPRVGRLRTANTPDNWHEVMFPHFDLWDDAPEGEEIWRHTELLVHLVASA